MVTILLWAIVGGLAGLIFGVTAGLPGRIIVFVVLLGAGSAAVPLIEGEVRNRRKVVRSMKAVNTPPAFAKASAGAAPHPLLVKERGKNGYNTSPFEGEVPAKAGGEVLAPDEARQWLDDFLVKQQEKPDSTLRV